MTRRPLRRLIPLLALLVFIMQPALPALIPLNVLGGPGQVVYAQGGGDGGEGGESGAADAGIFSEALKKIQEIGRDAWGFLVGLMVVIAVLGGLYLALQGTAGAAFGGSRMVSVAVIGGVGLVVIVMIAFLVLPELGSMLGEMQPDAPF